MLIALIFAQSLRAAPARPVFDTQVNDDSLVILCDQAGRFSIRAAADAASLERSYPRRTVIDPETLFVALPGYTGREDIRGPLIRYEICGPYTAKLEGDAYNLYVQGEAGAYPGFAAVTLFRGSRMIFAARLTECDRTLPRARGCPTGFAVRIDGRYRRDRKQLELVATTASNADGDSATRQVTVERSTEEDDLDLWRPSGD